LREFGNCGINNTKKLAHHGRIPIQFVNVQSICEDCIFIALASNSSQNKIKPHVRKTCQFNPYNLRGRNRIGDGYQTNNKFSHFFICTFFLEATKSNDENRANKGKEHTISYLILNLGGGRLQIG